MDVVFRVVGVAGHVAVSVVDLDGDSVAVSPTRVDHDPASGGVGVGSVISVYVDSCVAPSVVLRDHAPVSWPGPA